MSGPERHAHAIARANPDMPARKVAKIAGVRVDVARRIVAEADARRKAA